MRRLALVMFGAYFVSITALILFLFWPYPTHADAPCPDGRSCPDLWRCCEHGCCAPSTVTPSPRENEPKEPGLEWYFKWPTIFMVGILGAILAYAIWCLCYWSASDYCEARQYSCMFACCLRRPTSNHDSAGSCYPPPHYSRCGSFHQAPPPYSEVTSKPDLYPLVITCGEGDNKDGGNYLMVHYFRNYVIRGPGSLSATSTAESLNSSFLCNATNEANSIIPPPYSSAGNYSSWRGVGGGGGGGGGGVLLRSLSSLTEPRATPLPPLGQDLSPEDSYQATLIPSPTEPTDPRYNLDLDLMDYSMTGCKPQLGASPPVHSPSQNVIFEHDFERLLFTHNGSGSPPRATSPTQFPRDSRSDDRPRRETVKKNPRSRKSSLYMPLSSVCPRTSRMSPGSRMSSRSEPTTPCNVNLPSLHVLSQRLSSTRHGSRASRLDEENDLLLSDDNGARPDHKF